MFQEPTSQEKFFDYDSDSELPISASLPAGDPIQPSHDTNTRFLFGNINGFHIGNRGTPFTQICREVRTLEVDHAGFAEINSNVELLKVKRLLHDTTKREFHHLVMSTSISSTPCSSSFKPRGVMSLVQDDLVSGLIAKGKDSLGPWSYCKYSGRNGKIISVITIYQVCVRPTNKTGNTAYHQQVAQMALKNMGNNSPNAPTPQPRGCFRRDLLSLLRRWRASGEAIILLGDFNDDILQPNSPLQMLFQDRTLQFRLSIMVLSLSAVLGSFSFPPSKAKAKSPISSNIGTPTRTM
jgi:hypothetical protein